MSTFRDSENVRKRQALREAIVAKDRAKFDVTLTDIIFVKHYVVHFALAVISEFSDWRQWVPKFPNKQLLEFFGIICDHDPKLAGRMFDTEAMSFEDYCTTRSWWCFVQNWIYVAVEAQIVCGFDLNKMTWRMGSKRQRANFRAATVTPEMASRLLYTQSRLIELQENV
jgi:hypothetical protein